MLTDRTRMQTRQICPRLRLLTFHYGGLGIVPQLEGYELEFGRLYHAAQEGLLAPDADDAYLVRRAVTGLRIVVLELPTLPSPMFPQEQEALMEGLLWAWIRVKRPELVRDYEILSAEQEFLWTMGEFFVDGPSTVEPLVDMVRLDTLLKDRQTGSLYYREVKTAAYADDRWSMTFDHNAQVMANLRALEEALGQRPAGILIEGHRKGPRRRDTSQSSPFQGQEIQDSPLCYVYRSRAGELTLSWKWGSTRTPVWESGFTARGWVDDFLSEEDCRKLFVQLPPISPDPYHVERWRRQQLVAEAEIFRGLKILEDPETTPEEQTAILDRVFPLHEESCIRYGRKCSHYEICHNQAVAVEPLASGLFVPRTPHHAAEQALQEPPP